MVPGFSPTAIVVHHDVDDSYRALEESAKAGRKPQQAIWKRLQAAKLMIQSDGQWGDVVRKDDIPEFFREKYGVDNLYCVDLKNDVRCFYTIDERDIIFLDIVDHNEYDKWFPPKGSKKRRK